MKRNLLFRFISVLKKFKTSKKTQVVYKSEKNKKQSSASLEEEIFLSSGKGYEIIYMLVVGLSGDISWRGVMVGQTVVDLGGF